MLWLGCSEGYPKYPDERERIAGKAIFERMGNIPNFAGAEVRRQ
jgi:hypothetical protein